MPRPLERDPGDALIEHGTASGNRGMPERGCEAQAHRQCAGLFAMGSAKKTLELLACFLHPVAVVLMWIDLASRRDIGGGPKLAWALFGLIPLVPFIYVLTGGDLW